MDSGARSEWKIDVFRRKLQHSLAARFVLRFHVSMILTAAIVAGWLVDLWLLRFGMSSVMLRYPLAVVAAYVAFLAGVRLWIEYSGIRQFMSARRAKELVGDSITPASKYEPSRSSGVLELPSYDGEGCLFLLALGFVFFALGGYVWLNAAGLFAEVVLELLLAAGLLKGLRHVESSSWVVGVWRATRGSLVFTLAVALAVGWAIGTWAPEAHTLPQAIRLLKSAD